MQLLLPFFVICLYLTSAMAFFRVAKGCFHHLWALGILFIACQMHAFFLITTVGLTKYGAVNLSIFNVISIFAWSVAILSFFWLWQKSMALGGTMIGAINALLVALSTIFVSHKPFLESVQGGMIWHILVSIAAWTLFTIALVHSALYVFLFQRLKQKRLRNFNVASLTNLERLSMLYVLIGSILLVASLVSGWIFVDDLFAQHLWHKTVLTMLSAVTYLWTIFLYYGRHFRGLPVIYWSFVGYGLLMTGYVISNIILQFLIYKG